MRTQKPFEEPDDVPVRLVPFEWRFAPGIRETDKEPLKRAFGQAAFDWIMKAICEAVALLTPDSEPGVKVAFRVASGGSVTNHKTGQKVEILYTAIVRLKPHLTQVSLHLGSPEQIEQVSRISKRVFQHESAKAHGLLRDN